MRALDDFSVMVMPLDELLDMAQMTAAVGFSQEDVIGAAQVLDRLETQLGIQPGQTSADQEYTLETVNCLGACALAPLVIASGEYQKQMTAIKVDRLLKRVKRDA